MDPNDLRTPALMMVLGLIALWLWPIVVAWPRHPQRAAITATTVLSVVCGVMPAPPSLASMALLASAALWVIALIWSYTKSETARG